MADSFAYQLRQERIKVTAVVRKNKIVNAIAKKAIIPILDSLEEIYDEALLAVAQDAVELLRGSMHTAGPTGKRYLIVEFNPSAEPRSGERYKVISESYRASAPGQLPAELTGSLMESIDYELSGDGLMRIGQVHDYVGTELGSFFFRGAIKKGLYKGYAGTIFVGEEAPQTPARKYGTALETGWQNARGAYPGRPWFSHIMEQVREDFREEIRTQLKRALGRRTRSEQIKRAIVFRIYMTRK